MVHTNAPLSRDLVPRKLASPNGYGIGSSALGNPPLGPGGFVRRLDFHSHRQSAFQLRNGGQDEKNWDKVVAKLTHETDSLGVADRGEIDKTTKLIEDMIEVNKIPMVIQLLKYMDRRGMRVPSETYANFIVLLDKKGAWELLLQVYQVCGAPSSFMLSLFIEDACEII